MKLVNYKLQAQIETLNEPKSKDIFKEDLINILENDTRSHYQKADYIGLSISELKANIDNLSQDIRELQSLKKQYTESLNIAKELTAEVFIQNGIDRIDGNIISSITLSKQSTKTKDILSIKDKKEVMNLGYVKFEPDTQAILEAMATEDGKKELKNLVSISTETITTLAKVKINTKRTATNSPIITDELLKIEQTPSSKIKQQDFTQLESLGLKVIPQDESLIVVGDSIFENKEILKQNGFRWDGQNKTWYIPLEQVS